ncbi:methyl-accepting chemotaxis protein [Oceanospirillum sanctuarii]|uniref:methyl-accepting chemotaxis protein n=1 Tax=Oceanospirillum sanctuarii TaxID=1434821 RepID=UPI000A37F0B3|nr:methyl-accepting chemotaxis protein [Oceanospirillum sanctuarii]
MFKNLTLKATLNLAFGTLIILLLIISAVSYTGLNSTYQGFSGYRELARDTNLSARVQANMLSMRLAVLGFINTRDEAKIEEYNQRKANMDEYMKEAIREIQKPERAALIQEIATEINTYDSAFKNVIEDFNQRNEVVKKQLDPNGIKMRLLVTDIMESAYRDNDVDASYRAGVVQQHLILGRLYAVKYLVTNSDKDAKRAMKELNERMPEALTQLDMQLQNAERREKLRELMIAYKAYLAAFIQVQEIISHRNDLIQNTLNKIGPMVAEHIEEVKLSVKAEQDELGPQVQSESERSVLIVAAISLFALLVGVAMSLAMVRAIQRPVGGEPKTIDAITRLIAAGDLSQNLAVSNKDTGIYRSICEMSSKLKELISGLATTTRALEASADAGAEAASKNTQTIHHQKQMTDQVVVAIEEMSQSIHEVVQNATESATQAEAGREATDAGRDAVNQNLAAIQQLSQTLQAAMVDIHDLEQKSQEIGTVITVIEGISEQTSLLALNAAIEAARAGESGRGFAVVADEVRMLAQKTQDSTTEIQQIIQGLQNTTTRSVAAMKECTSQAEQSVVLSEQTNEALHAIGGIIDGIATMNGNVAAAVEEQSAVANDIARNMATISTTVEETSDRVMDAERASKEVQKMADDLGHLMSGFKI